MRTYFKILMIVCVLLAGQASAQDDPIQVDPGNQNQNFDSGLTDGTANTGGGGTTGSDGVVEPVELDLAGNLEDTRNQGFVGATSDRVQELGFVGASSENSGPPLADGATFGGGVNNSGTRAGGGGGFGGNQFQGGGFNGGFGGQNQFGAGTQNGFQVIRRNLRSNLVPQISVAPVSSGETAIRFQERIARQPLPRSIAVRQSARTPVSSVNVTIDERTAVLSGFVDSPVEKDRWERQLRLEPGVDRIINRIEVVPTIVSPAQ